MRSFCASPNTIEDIDPSQASRRCCARLRSQLSRSGKAEQAILDRVGCNSSVASSLRAADERIVLATLEVDQANDTGAIDLTYEINFRFVAINGGRQSMNGFLDFLRPLLPPPGTSVQWHLGGAFVIPQPAQALASRR